MQGYKVTYVYIFLNPFIFTKYIQTNISIWYQMIAIFQIFFQIKSVQTEILKTICQNLDHLR